jgi:hypothetical protein
MRESARLARENRSFAPESARFARESTRLARENRSFAPESARFARESTRLARENQRRGWENRTGQGVASRIPVADPGVIPGGKKADTAPVDFRVRDGESGIGAGLSL